VGGWGGGVGEGFFGGVGGWGVWLCGVFVDVGWLRLGMVLGVVFCGGGFFLVVRWNRRDKCAMWQPSSFFVFSPDGGNRNRTLRVKSVREGRRAGGAHLANQEGRGGGGKRTTTKKKEGGVENLGFTSATK